MPSIWMWVQSGPFNGEGIIVRATSTKITSSTFSSIYGAVLGENEKCSLRENSPGVIPNRTTALGYASLKNSCATVVGADVNEPTLHQFYKNMSGRKGCYSGRPLPPPEKRFD